MLVLLRGIAWGYAILPASFQYFLGNFLGLIFRIVKLRAKVVEQNLQIAYPGEDAETQSKRKKLFQASYRHLGNLVFEVLMVLGPLKSFVAKNVEVRGIENWRAAKKLGKGVIFVSSHVGNWEIMGATGWIYGMDLMFVTKRLKPGWLHKAVEMGRLKCSVQGTYEPRTYRDVLSHIKKNGTVGFVLDQYAGPPVGVRVPVFGVPVGTASAPAAIAKRTGAPVLPVVNYRTGRGKWMIEIRPPIPWRKFPQSTQELAMNTAIYAETLEKDIRAHPEQWMWIHRRFKGDLSPLKENEWMQGRVRA